MIFTEKKWINAVAPIRICDIGGWTDTWFAKYGSVFNIAIYPYVEVQIGIIDDPKETEKIHINVENYGEKYTFTPERKIKGCFGETISYRPPHSEFGKHPLIEATLDYIHFPKDKGLNINIYSDAPPGASTGTSAAVSVALVGALGKLVKGCLTAHEVAMLAYVIETERLHLQCGVQDQLASAYGGANYINIMDFPNSIVSPVNVVDSVWWEFEQRLCLVYIGKPHKSSEIHNVVIESLGKNAASDNRINALRILAKEAKDAFGEGNFVEFGRIMNENTEVQRSLHPSLVCEKTDEIIEMANRYGAIGHKVNGAGGDGGSITLLFGEDRSEKRKFLDEINRKNIKHLPIYLSRKGLRVW